MRIKKIIIFFVLLIVLLSTTTYAVTLKNKSLENKNSNTISNEKKEANKTTEILKTKKASKENVINEDVVSFKEDDIEYKNVIINGNMFIFNCANVNFENVKVNGDVFIVASKVEITNSKIEGNAFLASKDNISIIESEFISIYTCSYKVEIDENVEISRELRIVGNDIYINGEVQKDAYIIANKAEIGDKAVIFGKTDLKSDSYILSKEADLKDFKYEKIESTDKINIKFEKNIFNFKSYFIDRVVNLVLLLITALFIICCFPKFTELNRSLKLRSFIKDFFLGILDIFLIIVLAVLLCISIFGAVYGLVLLNLFIIFIVLGRIIFVIAFALRLCFNDERISKIKIVFATLLVALVIELIQMLIFTGTAGTIIVVVINFILTITGFGTLIRTIFSKNKNVHCECQKNVISNYNESVVNNENIQKNTDKAIEKNEIKNEIKKEIQEEINELKKEYEKENKIKENNESKENPDNENNK